MKTYAHSLRLQQERLEDVSQKKRDLAHAVDKKRLELLELKQKERHDLTLATQIHELREKVRAYETAVKAEPELPKGVVRLGKKAEDGRIVRVDAPQAAIPAE